MKTVETYEEGLELEIDFTDKALKYLKNELSSVDCSHIGAVMKEKIIGIVEDLVYPLKLAIESAPVLHGMSNAKQVELLVALEDIEKQNRADLDRLLP